MFLLIFLSRGPKCSLEFSLGSKLAFFFFFFLLLRPTMEKGHCKMQGEDGHLKLEKLCFRP